MNTKIIARVIFLLLTALFIASRDTNAQTNEQNINVTVRQAQTPDGRGACLGMKSKRRVAQSCREKNARLKNLPIAETNPRRC